MPSAASHNRLCSHCVRSSLPLCPGPSGLKHISCSMAWKTWLNAWTMEKLWECVNNGKVVRLWFVFVLSLFLTLFAFECWASSLAAWKSDLSETRNNIFSVCVDPCILFTIFCHYDQTTLQILLPSLLKPILLRVTVFIGPLHGKRRRAVLLGMFMKAWLLKLWNHSYLEGRANGLCFSMSYDSVFLPVFACLAEGYRKGRKERKKVKHLFILVCISLHGLEFASASQDFISCG